MDKKDVYKNFMLFANCVRSLRTAEKEYEKENNGRNKAIVNDLQYKVDQWLEWVQKQEDGSTISAVPYYTGKSSPMSRQRGGGRINQDVIEQLSQNHSQEEIDELLKGMG